MTQQSDETLAALAHATGRNTEAVARLHGLLVNDVIATETVKMPATGLCERSYQVPYGYVTVANYGTNPITFAAATAGDPSAPPTAGVGVVRVPAGRFASVPISGRSLTLYGTAGDVAVLSVTTRGHRPAFGTCA